VGRLIVIEGLDGAGKRTLADGVEKALLDAGVKVSRDAFPRYGRSPAADLVKHALYGRAGRLSDSTDGMAVLYAMDRAEASADIRKALDEHGVVLLDRYVASNAAYGAARLGQNADGDFVGWVRQLEVDLLAVPVPDLQLLLKVPDWLAAKRAGQRAIEETSRSRDNFESDEDLQTRVAAIYDELAERNWLSRWRVLDGAVEIDHQALAVSLLA
jgi:dTMP kinase